MTLINAPLSRRQMLRQAGAGFGSLALTHLLSRDLLAAGKKPEFPGLPHHAQKAKSVIFLFMEGGPSHIDLFDPKPVLNKLAGQKLPESYGKIITAMGEYDAPLMACDRIFKRHGQAGTWVSDWLPHIATCVDDIAVVRSCWANGINHATGVCQMNTGSILAGRPCLGSWVNYGLGSENDSLPAFVVMLDEGDRIVGGPKNYGTGFMPATFQGTRIVGGDEPIPYLHPTRELTAQRQRGKLQLIEQMNREHADSRQFESDLDARIRAYELAFRMQAEAPEAVDINSESQHIKDAYGMGAKETEAMGRNCLMARRLVERGVRFVQIYSGANSKWDAHSKIDANHTKMCRSSDQPIAALLKDLKARGLLESTLVVWGGEFGRTPMSEKGDGRDHNPWGFTMWMAGGGVKGGITVGATDDIGLRAVEDRVHVHDLHATILHLTGLNHKKLNYLNNGRRESPTINEGEVVKKLLA